MELLTDFLSLGRGFVISSYSDSPGTGTKADDVL